MTHRAGAIRIGISGWRYAGWRGVFYPPGLAQRRELEHASRTFPTLEINGSFYSLQAAASWRAWRDTVPPGFVFAVKGSRFITHMKQLRDCRGPLANFFASGLLRLGERLGPILWQLPPRSRYDEGKLEEFLALLPRDTAAAARLAAEHDERVKDPAPQAARRARLRHALEIRHESFCVPAVVRQLRRHRVGLVVADTSGEYPSPADLTAPFVYVRLHGVEGMYAGSYPDDQLDAWAARISAWSRGGQPPDVELVTPGPRPQRAAGRDVYVYFDNDQKARAPFDAQRLMERLDLGWAPAAGEREEAPPQRPRRPLQRRR